GPAHSVDPQREKIDRKLMCIYDIVVILRRDDPSVEVPGRTRTGQECSTGGVEVRPSPTADDDRFVALVGRKHRRDLPVLLNVVCWCCVGVEIQVNCLLLKRNRCLFCRGFSSFHHRFPPQCRSIVSECNENAAHRRACVPLVSPMRIAIVSLLSRSAFSWFES